MCILHNCFKTILTSLSTSCLTSGIQQSSISEAIWNLSSDDGVSLFPNLQWFQMNYSIVFLFWHSVPVTALTSFICPSLSYPLAMHHSLVTKFLAYPHLLIFSLTQAVLTNYYTFLPLLFFIYPNPTHLPNIISIIISSMEIGIIHKHTQIHVRPSTHTLLYPPPLHSILNYPRSN